MLVRDPERRFSRTEPVTERGRTVFVNDHLVHASHLAPLVPRALDLAELLVAWPSPRGLAPSGVPWPACSERATGAA